MAYAVWSVVFGEQPSAAKWNILGTNDASFNDGTGIATNAITAAKLSTSAITLGYTEILTDFTTTAVSTTTDVTSLAVTVTVPAGGRRCKITAWCGSIYSTAIAGTGISTYIRESTTTLASTSINQGGSQYGSISTTMYSAVLSSGSHTYKVSISQSAAGTLHFVGAATQPTFILVEAI